MLYCGRVTPMRETPVLIVGGGPVGPSATVSLGRLGVPCVVIERDSWVTDHPKARGVNIRTMELFRQWALTAKCAGADCRSARAGSIIGPIWAGRRSGVHRIPVGRGKAGQR